MSNEIADPWLDPTVINSIIHEIGTITPCDDTENAHKEDALNWLKSGISP